MQDQPTCELCERQVGRDEVVESMASLNFIACHACLTHTERGKDTPCTA